jgi:hypothetical protein
MKGCQIAQRPGRVTDGHTGDIPGLPCRDGQIPCSIRVDKQTAGTLVNDIADKGMTVMDITDNGYKQIICGYAAGVNTYRIKSVFFSATQQLASGGFKDFTHCPW